MPWADAKATPANSAAVVIKSWFLIFERFLYLVPRTARPDKTKEMLGEFQTNAIYFRCSGFPSGVALFKALQIKALSKLIAL
jgi:hypothetical protein